MFALAMTWFRTNPRNVWLIAGLLAALAAVTFIYLKGRGDEARETRAERAVAVAEAVRSDNLADAKSTAAVLRDAETIAATREELIDAIAQAPDSLPDAASVVYGCRELQRHGIRTADLPACAPAAR